ncbi:MAG TPA: DUF2621 family protein [Candidatus Omnitrophota bacterium]|nr:DUF2621 family protein [Candidatus Omnitrophota bacterium]HPD85526.1 DUF2621 family protein [Candidatus Omnitrophota bacterium]HRZ04434.1 DUF2621 family protein [Candidatus Omnitrophota bacterium]
MPNTQANASQQSPWDSEARKKFENVIARLPLFHRDIARNVVYKKAEINARERSAKLVEEQDIVRAFFTEVPIAFYSLMVKLLGDAGFDYKKYETR